VGLGLMGVKPLEVLRNTFIQPEKTETLFELYWIIKITKQFRRLVGPIMGHAVLDQFSENDEKVFKFTTHWYPLPDPLCY